MKDFVVELDRCEEKCEKNENNYSMYGLLQCSNDIKILYLENWKYESLSFLGIDKKKLRLFGSKKWSIGFKRLKVIKNLLKQSGPLPQIISTFLSLQST